MSKHRRLIIFIFMVVLILASLAYGIFLGDPADMRVEASGL